MGRESNPPQHRCHEEPHRRADEQDQDPEDVVEAAAPGIGAAATHHLDEASSGSQEEQREV